MKINTNAESLVAVEREREREGTSPYWTWNSFTRPHTHTQWLCLPNSVRRH